MGVLGGISLSASSTQGILRNLATSRTGINRSLERLATGKQINRAADDPAGSMKVTELQAREKTLLKQIENGKRTDARLSALDGAHAGLGEIVMEVKSRVLQAANAGGTSPEELDALQLEVDSLLDAYDFSTQTFTFEGSQMLSGVTTKSIAIDGPPLTEGGDPQTFTLADFRSGGKLSLSNRSTFQKYADTTTSVLDAAQDFTTTTRASIGNAARENDSKTEGMRRELDELRGVKSLIEDTDYGKETAELARNQILNDAQNFLLSVTSNQHKELITNLLSTLKKEPTYRPIA